MPTTTTRRSFQRVALTDAADIVASIAAFEDQVDLQIGSIAQGTLASRPAVGKDGDIYIARDDTSFGPNGSPAWWDSANSIWRPLKHAASHGYSGADALAGTGTYAARPAANTVPAGYVYKATNAGTYVSDGTNWAMLAPGFFSLAIATTETRTNAAYGLLPTPDRIQGLALPPNGMFKVGYQATWQNSVLDAARAAIFLGANQVKSAIVGSSSPINTEASITSVPVNNDTQLASYLAGLASYQGSSSFTSAYTGDVTTGQAIGGGTIATVIVGGLCNIFAAAGLYDVSVQYKASSGNVIAKNRKLWVEVWGV